MQCQGQKESRWPTKERHKFAGISGKTVSDETLAGAAAEPESPRMLFRTGISVTREGFTVHMHLMGSLPHVISIQRGSAGSLRLHSRFGASSGREQGVI